jgi:hypothetical protein
MKLLHVVLVMLLTVGAFTFAVPGQSPAFAALPPIPCGYLVTNLGVGFHNNYTEWNCYTHKLIHSQIDGDACVIINDALNDARGNNSHSVELAPVQGPTGGAYQCTSSLVVPNEGSLISASQNPTSVDVLINFTFTGPIGLDASGGAVTLSGIQVISSPGVSNTVVVGSSSLVRDLEVVNTAPSNKSFAFVDESAAFTVVDNVVAASQDGGGAFMFNGSVENNIASNLMGSNGGTGGLAFDINGTQYTMTNVQSFSGPIRLGSQTRFGDFTNFVATYGVQIDQGAILNTFTGWGYVGSVTNNAGLNTACPPFGGMLCQQIPDASCPAGQALTQYNVTTFTCTPIGGQQIPDASCPTGQVLTQFNATTFTCTPQGGGPGISSCNPLFGYVCQTPTNQTATTSTSSVLVYITGNSTRTCAPGQCLPPEVTIAGIPVLDLVFGIAIILLVLVAAYVYGRTKKKDRGGLSRAESASRIL